jgi:phage baseplate assembly protein W
VADPVSALQFPVAIDAALGRVKQETDYEKYIAQLIRQVLLTSPGERAQRPDFGAGLRRMVFAPVDNATAALLQTAILEALNRWLGTLITLDDVQVVVNNAELDVTVFYTLKARGTKQVLNLEVTG